MIDFKLHHMLKDVEAYNDVKAVVGKLDNVGPTGYAKIHAGITGGRGINRQCYRLGIKIHSGDMIGAEAGDR